MDINLLNHKLTVTKFSRYLGWGNKPMLKGLSIWSRLARLLTWVGPNSSCLHMVILIPLHRDEISAITSKYGALETFARRVCCDYTWYYDFFPNLFYSYFIVIFSMFCIEQAKIYREPKFGSDRAFDGWTIGKLKCQILENDLFKLISRLRLATSSRYFVSILRLAISSRDFVSRCKTVVTQKWSTCSKST